METTRGHARRWALWGMVVLMLGWTAPGLAAQTLQASDISGIAITGSGVVIPAVGFAVPTHDRVLSFRTQADAIHFHRAAGVVLRTVDDGALRDLAGSVVPAATQRTFADFFRGGPDAAAAKPWLRAMLVGDDPSSEAGPAADAFLEASAGLLGAGMAMDVAFYNTRTATEYATAVAAYNALVSVAPSSALVSETGAYPGLYAIFQALDGS